MLHVWSLWYECDKVKKLIILTVTIENKLMPNNAIDKMRIHILICMESTCYWLSVQLETELTIYSLVVLVSFTLMLKKNKINFVINIAEIRLGGAVITDQCWVDLEFYSINQSQIGPGRLWRHNFLA